MAEKVIPALVELGKQKQQQPMYQPQQLPPMPPPAEQLPPEPQQLSQETSSELTPSERQMSKTMSDIYINPQDKKKE